MLHNLKRPDGLKKHVKRLGKGPGSGTGKQAGKGHKGKKARSGGSTPRYFEGGQMPIYRRLPKRGFKNPFKKEFRIVNLHQLSDITESIIDITILEEKAIIRSQGHYKGLPVKILADRGTEFTKAVTIKANAFSSAAKEIIEKNGGKVEVV
jgi:large subunit ribosomal protein L15